MHPKYRGFMKISEESPAPHTNIRPALQISPLTSQTISSYVPSGNGDVPSHPSQDHSSFPESTPSYGQGTQFSDDLEKLRRLKEAILSGKHPDFKPIPRPDALAALYLGPNNTSQASVERRSSVGPLSAQSNQPSSAIPPAVASNNEAMRRSITAESPISLPRNSFNDPNASLRESRVSSTSDRSTATARPQPSSASPRPPVNADTQTRAVISVTTNGVQRRSGGLQTPPTPTSSSRDDMVSRPSSQYDDKNRPPIPTYRPDDYQRQSLPNTNLPRASYTSTRPVFPPRLDSRGFTSGPRPSDSRLPPREDDRDIETDRQRERHAEYRPLDDRRPDERFARPSDQVSAQTATRRTSDRLSTGRDGLQTTVAPTPSFERHHEIPPRPTAPSSDGLSKARNDVTAPNVSGGIASLSRVSSAPTLAESDRRYRPTPPQDIDSNVARLSPASATTTSYKPTNPGGVDNRPSVPQTVAPDTRTSRPATHMASSSENDDRRSPRPSTGGDRVTRDVNTSEERHTASTSNEDISSRQLRPSNQIDANRVATDSRPRNPNNEKPSVEASTTLARTAVHGRPTQPSNVRPNPLPQERETNRSTHTNHAVTSTHEREPLPARSRDTPPRANNPAPLPGYREANARVLENRPAKAGADSDLRPDLSRGLHETSTLDERDRVRYQDPRRWRGRDPYPPHLTRDDMYLSDRDPPPRSPEPRDWAPRDDPRSYRPAPPEWDRRDGREYLPAVWDRDRPPLERDIPSEHSMFLPSKAWEPRDDRRLSPVPFAEAPPQSRSWESPPYRGAPPRLADRLSDPHPLDERPTRGTEPQRYGSSYPSPPRDSRNIRPRSPSPMRRPGLQSRPPADTDMGRPMKRPRDELSDPPYYIGGREPRGHPTPYDYPPRPGSPGYYGIGHPSNMTPYSPPKDYRIRTPPYEPYREPLFPPRR